MQNKKPKVGTGIVILNKNKELLFCKRTYAPIGWSMAGGHLEYGETLEECAKREAMEEAGIEIDNVKPMAIAEDIFPDRELHYVTAFVFSTIRDNQTPKNMEPNKCDGWEWFSIDNLPSPLSFNYAPLLHNGKKLIEQYLEDIKND